MGNRIRRLNIMAKRTRATPLLDDLDPRLNAIARVREILLKHAGTTKAHSDSIEVPRRDGTIDSTRLQPFDADEVRRLIGRFELRP